MIVFCALLNIVYPGGRHSDTGWSRRKIWPDYGICRDPTPRSVHDTTPPVDHPGDKPGISAQTCEYIVNENMKLPTVQLTAPILLFVFCLIVLDI